MRVVVDANIAKAAGHAKPGAGPPGPVAVEALAAVERGGHHVAMGPRLKAEWDRHAQHHAMKWLGAMIARKRWVHLPDDAWDGETALLAAVEALPGDQAAAVAKDAHLVALAMRTDRRVLSFDAKQRELLRGLNDVKKLLAGLHWADPRAAGVLAWVEAGAWANPSLTVAGS